LRKPGAAGATILVGNKPKYLGQADQAETLHAADMMILVEMCTLEKKKQRNNNRNDKNTR